jgi:lysophospholipase L1-like esterase
MVAFKLVQLAALVASILPASTSALAAPPTYGQITPKPRDGRWVDTWGSMPQLTEPANLPPPPFVRNHLPENIITTSPNNPNQNQTGLVFADSSVRQTLHMSIGAQQIRIRLSNAFGLTDLPITKATIAHPVAGSGYNKTGSPIIDPNSLQTLTFGGNASITIPNGALAVSDPLDFPIAPESVISITLYLATGQTTNSITSHPGSRTGSWISSGDQTSARNFSTPSAVQSFHWYFLSAVEAWSPLDAGALIVVGDSITDGRGSYNNANGRWPDLVVKRLQQNKATKDKVGVINQAAGGNRVLYDGLGPNALGRIDRDVLAHSGVQYAMVFEGVNDIGTTADNAAAQAQTGDRLIQAFEQMRARVHARGIPFFGATITPFGCYNSTLQSYSTVLREQTRLRVNDWIRNSGSFDAVVDFDAALRDPKNETQLAAAYDSGDCLHPSPVGYQRMADSFPLDVFGRFKNGVSGFN